MLSKETERYLIAFLLGQNASHVSDSIVYCKYQEIRPDNKVVIVRSHFFDEDVYGTQDSLPKLPLSLLDGLPILFGENRIEEKGDQTIIYADIIASAYFLLTRYEEIVRRDVRDPNGRFIGKESLPYRAGFIDRPIVDEYGKYLRSILRGKGFCFPEDKTGFTNIYLSHDVDFPWEPFVFRTAAKRSARILLREHRLDLYPFFNWVGSPQRDPLYTFPYFFENDARIHQATVMYFVKSGGQGKQDAHLYIHDRGCRQLLRKIKQNGGIIGYHVSYAAGGNTSLIGEEIQTLKEVSRDTITVSRNHYLRSCEPEDYLELIRCGITEDFTMGYADVCGFRIGTCRPVRWINPSDGMLTELILHHLTMMERSLLGDAYMGLQYEEARLYAQKLISNVWNMGGELDLLWHNDRKSLPAMKLYSEVIDYLRKTQSEI